jgi:hypothetical protein
VASLRDFADNPAAMRRKAIYHGGTVAGTCRYQVGLLELACHNLSYTALGKRPDERVSLSIPSASILSADLHKRKGYSSTDFILEIRFADPEGKEETLLLELVVWLKRGRALRIGRRWVEALRAAAGSPGR